MATQEFPSNSDKTKKAAASASERPKVDKVISGEIVRRKKPVGVRFKEIFLGGDDVKGVFSYVLNDVIIPDINNMIVDAGTTALERRFLGSERSASRRRGSNVVNTLAGQFATNYGAYSSGPVGSPNVEQHARMSRRGRVTHDIAEKVIPTRAEAEAVLDTMYEILQKFEEVTLAEVLTMLGETPQFSDETFGWSNLQGAGVQRARGGGYYLALPGTEKLA